MNTSIPQLNWWETTLSLLPILFAGWFLQRWCGTGRLLAYASSRMLLQLLAVGFVLLILFQEPSFWIGGLVLVIMILASSTIALRNVNLHRKRQFLFFLFALVTCGIPILLLDLFIVQKGPPIYQPRLLIPLAGMVFGNAMNSLSLAAERFEAERKRAGDFDFARKTAFNAAMIPQINGFLSVGLVSLPGMMTGQILAGISPLVAVRYQIMIMAMFLGSAGLCVAVYFLLLKIALPDSPSTPERREALP